MGYQRRVHGDHYSSVTQWVVIINMQSILIASCLAAAAMAEADAFYGYGNALVGPSGMGAAWPTAVGYGHQSTVYGARPYAYGKRSADADAFYGAYGNALVGPSGVSPAWPTAVGYGHQTTVYGARPYYGKRSADADAYYGYGYGLARGVAVHPGVATSYTHRSPQGLHGLVGHYYGNGVGIYNNNVYSGFHGNHYANGLPGRSFAAVTRGKRSAEAEAEADPYYGYGYGRAYGYGHGYGYGHHGGYYGH